MSRLEKIGWLSLQGDFGGVTGETKMNENVFFPRSAQTLAGKMILCVYKAARNIPEDLQWRMRLLWLTVRSGAVGLRWSKGHSAQPSRMGWQQWNGCTQADGTVGAKTGVETSEPGLQSSKQRGWARGRRCKRRRDEKKLKGWRSAVGESHDKRIHG